jgi:hypothetical protein
LNLNKPVKHIIPLKRSNPLTNQGYYFEIAALTDSNISTYLKTDTTGTTTMNLDNILFYKIQKSFVYMCVVSSHHKHPLLHLLSLYPP